MGGLSVSLRQDKRRRQKGASVEPITIHRSSEFSCMHAYHIMQCTAKDRGSFLFAKRFVVSKVLEKKGTNQAVNPRSASA